MITIDPTHAVAVLTQLAQMYRDGSRTDLAVVWGASGGSRCMGAY